jgi:LacI family transcriptional regulator
MNIKRVAARARVSTATISRTINNSPLVSPETAEKVWRAIRELGYYPNTQARALVSGKSRMFGLIISDISNPFFPELVKSFEQTAMRHDYEVIVANTDYESVRMAACVRRMIERNVDGVAIMTSEIEPHLIEELERRHTPIVFLDLGKVGHLISNISVNYAKGVQEAVYHLANLGHRRIAFISGPRSLKSACTRRKAFLSCLRSCGITERQRIVVEGNHRIDGGEAAMREILASDRVPTAVIASNDLTAIGALRALNEAGYRVPQDISLIGFDDILLSEFTQPPLTTVRLSREELGKKAFEALYLSSQPDSKGQEVRVDTSLVLRSSTGNVNPTLV